MAASNDGRLFKNRHYASRFFGADNSGQKMTQIPRTKFMFYANFVVGKDATLIDPKLKDLGTIDSGISFKIRTIDKPKVNFAITELNQYNRRRYAYTKIEYQPITIRIFDTVDNRPLNLWKRYFTYYFGDSRPSKSNQIILNNGPTDPTFEDGTGWGLRPIAEDLTFFDRLEVYSFYANKYTQFNYLNPKIATIDFTNYDTSSSDPDDLQMTIRYEAIEYLEEQAISDQQAAQFGFTGIQYPPDDELTRFKG